MGSTWIVRAPSVSWNGCGEEIVSTAPGAYLTAHVIRLCVRICIAHQTQGRCEAGASNCWLPYRRVGARIATGCSGSPSRASADEVALVVARSGKRWRWYRARSRVTMPLTVAATKTKRDMACPTRPRLSSGRALVLPAPLCFGRLQRLSGGGDGPVEGISLTNQFAQQMVPVRPYFSNPTHVHLPAAQLLADFAPHWIVVLGEP